MGVYGTIKMPLYFLISDKEVQVSRCILTVQLTDGKIEFVHYITVLSIKMSIPVHVILPVCLRLFAK